MPKRKSKPEEPNAPQGEPLEGFPEHGDVLEEPQSDNPQSEPETQEPSKPDPMAEIRSQLDELRRENQQLKQMIPPATQARPQPEAAGPQEPDWEQLLWHDPNEAFKRHAEHIRKQVREELRSEYQRDQGTQRFWQDFYSRHQDLREDRDLVELTLNSNLSKLTNVPVSEAIDQLADLTRQRILRYSGKPQSRSRRAMVEGAEPPRPTAQREEEPSITSLSDLIKARRVKRTTAA